MNRDEIHATVKERYASLARGSSSSGCCDAPGSCCGEGETASRKSAHEYNAFPREIAGASLGCGTPIQHANLLPGETVLDLGSGAGLDCFTAARVVGEEGIVIGVDMTEEMIKLAREHQARLGIENVLFRKGYIESLPVESQSVDVVISNCVINLLFDKQSAFNEMWRVLRPGGRLIVSDVVLNGELPEAIARDPEAWAACIAGALSVETYMEMMAQAGFGDLRILERSGFGSTIETDHDTSLFKVILWGVRP